MDVKSIKPLPQHYEWEIAFSGLFWDKVYHFHDMNLIAERLPEWRTVGPVEVMRCVDAIKRFKRDEEFARRVAVNVPNAWYKYHLADA